MKKKRAVARFELRRREEERGVSNPPPLSVIPCRRKIDLSKFSTTTLSSFQLYISPDLRIFFFVSTYQLLLKHFPSLSHRSDSHDSSCRFSFLMHFYLILLFNCSIFTWDRGWSFETCFASIHHFSYYYYYKFILDRWSQLFTFRVWNWWLTFCDFCFGFGWW